MRIVPILDEEHHHLHVNAGLVLIGHMLFPNQPIDRGMYIDLPERECALAFHSLDEEEDYTPSIALNAIIKTRKARTKNGILAGAVLQKKIQLYRHNGDVSTRKAIWLVGKETANSKMKPGIEENTRRTLKRQYKTFADVAHLWAAWKILSPEERERIQGSGSVMDKNVLLKFLGIASWFQSHLLEIEGSHNAESDRAVWMVPDIFSVPQDALCVPMLPASDRTELLAYKSGEY